MWKNGMNAIMLQYNVKKKKKKRTSHCSETYLCMKVIMFTFSVAVSVLVSKAGIYASVILLCIALYCNVLVLFCPSPVDFEGRFLFVFLFCFLCKRPTAHI